ncbi:conserved hypothetical protein [Altererythrobacter sp. B11]|uniref:hypothetical protein n=1 Tax=Altererythrobacter sp. B11 TaxID=2060312 RepID=UPI000DC6EAF4|nr:hypothetical protein [Altererythrobacter sp. B11]BBC73807.1 conserved hypothetical protein [Altererythrobacter sp. B11]
MTPHRLLLATLSGVSALALAPSAAAQAPGEPSAVIAPECARECLIALVRQHMAALERRDASALPLTRDVLFTENNVPLAPGEGLWATVTDVDDSGLEAADPITGQAAWFGSVRENGNPAFYALRMHVTSQGLIDEIETVVHRKTALPAPFGDWQNMEHFPEYNAVLPETERRPRERMLAIADAYFDTVELNDGQVFAPFAEDCSRLENGISTTAAPQGGKGGNAAAIAQGCEEQFRLGIYKINKRIRRHLPLVDVERGVVVASGFFDHANEFDRYRLTNGREMRTVLKWPNSITLLEAFRIRNAEIQRIEAVFTYVPYFMHNPFWGPGSQPPEYAARPRECDNGCLNGNVRALVNAMAGSDDWRGLNWSDRVGYAENSVGIRVGEGIWAAVDSVDRNPLVVSDAQTGRAVWIGRIEEHGQPAWAAITMEADGKAIGNVDALIRRSEYGPPYAAPDEAPAFAALPAPRRTSRADMSTVATQLFASIEAGDAPDVFASQCRWHVNGQQVAQCGEVAGMPGLPRIGAVRDRRLLAMDEESGLAVYRTFEDAPATQGQGYPASFQVVNVLRFENGKIAEVHAFTSELPYGMRPPGEAALR